MNNHTTRSSLQFLNDAMDEFPSAVSFAAGRPAPLLFHQLQGLGLENAMAKFCTRAQNLQSSILPFSRIWQYGPTAGFIGDLIAKHLYNDERICVDPEWIVVTAGCQEALTLCISTLCPMPSDVLLVCNPTYVGTIEAARIQNVHLASLGSNPDLFAIDIDRLSENLTRNGRRIRGLYVTPTFDNPTGRTLSVAQRKALLEACACHEIVILEDNAYGLFRFEGADLPSLFELDKVGCVIYLSTYSKSLAPALRIGAAILPSKLFGRQAGASHLRDSILRRKSAFSLNTSQLSQAIVGGILLTNDCSLRKWIAPALDLYRRNRDLMLASLYHECSSHGLSNVQWNRPSGGFFLRVELPIPFTIHAAIECARRAGVIVTPMSLFALDGSEDYRIRLSFSDVSSDDIQRGVSSLIEFIREPFVQ